MEPCDIASIRPDEASEGPDFGVITAKSAARTAGLSARRTRARLVVGGRDGAIDRMI